MRIGPMFRSDTLKRCVATDAAHLCKGKEEDMGFLLTLLVIVIIIAALFLSTLFIVP